MLNVSNGLSKSDNLTFPPLPSKWDKLYKIKEIVYLSDNSRIFLVDDINNNSVKILKIITSTPMIKDVLKVLSKIRDKYLLLPEKYYLYNNLYYIIFPYKDTLLKKIFSHGITSKEINVLADNICSALDTLHKHHILHLDINPGNIFCNDDDTFCLGDYSSSTIFPVKTNYTIAGLTPGYISNEIANGDSPTVLSDYHMMLQTIYVLYNDGNNEIYNFNIDSKNSLQNNISSLINNLNISTDYCLHITDKTHPLFYLKTCTLQQSFKTKRINKQNNIINRKRIIYFFLITICALLMIKSYKMYQISLNHSIQLNNKSDNPIPYTTTPTISYTTPPEPSLTPSTSTIPSYNPLTTSPSYIMSSEPSQTPSPSSNQPQITELDISGKNFSSIPDKYLTSEYTSSVTSIYCCSCNLKTLQNISEFSNLCELYITDNNITSIDSLYKNNKLNTLIISYNDVHDISSLSLCQNLSTLDLSGNHNMSNIKSLSTLKSLKLLNLTNTNISDSEIKFLKKELKKCTIIY